jgi:HAD superfamily hydrolase (TIGR01509 family)
MTRLQALIFDVDGTLADNERDGHRVAFNEAFAAYGLDWDWSPDFYGKLLSVAGGKERIKFYVETYRTGELSPNDMDAFIAALHREKTRLYTDLITQHRLPLRIGVKRLIVEARNAGFKLGIASTTTLVNVTTLLENALAPDAVQWFDVIAAGDIVKAKKPAPDIYHYALNGLKLQPNQCLAFEDSANGLQAATKAGLKTLITYNDYTATQNFEQAIFISDHLGDPQIPCTIRKSPIQNINLVDISLLKKLL